MGDLLIIHGENPRKQMKAAAFKNQVIQEPDKVLKMGRKPKGNYHSFFKVLIGDFVNKLGIPPAFVKNLRGNVPSNFTLESRSGRSWRVTVEDKGGDYFFCGGWSTFVKDHCLEHGDFLVFFLLGNSTFDIIVYGRTACEKHTILPAKRRRGRPAINRQNEEIPSNSCASFSKKARGASRGRGISCNEEIEFVSEVAPTRPLFLVVLKEYHKYNVGVPSCFVKQTGLAGKRRTVIKDQKGRMWPMNTIVDPRTSQVRLGAGWAKFLRENRIVVGDALWFEHIPNTGNSIHVKNISKARRWK